MPMTFHLSWRSNNDTLMTEAREWPVLHYTRHNNDHLVTFPTTSKKTSPPKPAPKRVRSAKTFVNWYSTHQRACLSWRQSGVVEGDGGTAPHQWWGVVVRRTRGPPSSLLGVETSSPLKTLSTTITQKYISRSYFLRSVLHFYQWITHIIMHTFNVRIHLYRYLHIVKQNFPFFKTVYCFIGFMYSSVHRLSLNATMKVYMSRIILPFILFRHVTNLWNIITVLSVECGYPKIIVSSSILGNSIHVIFCHPVTSVFQNSKTLGQMISKSGERDAPIIPGNTIHLNLFLSKRCQIFVS